MDAKTTTAKPGMTEILTPGAAAGADAVATPNSPVSAPATPRYHALDFVRATAMFLGVFYHLQFTTMSFENLGAPPSNAFGDNPMLTVAVSHASPRRGFISSEPARIWENALVSDNGKYGARVFAQALDETIVLNHARLFMPLNPPLSPAGPGKGAVGCELRLAQRPTKGVGGWGAEQMFKDGIKEVQAGAEGDTLTYRSSFRRTWPGGLQGYEGTARVVAKPCNPVRVSKDNLRDDLRPAKREQERPSRPLVGAIRWDAWSGGGVTEEVERTLGPAKYHDRLPWFAEVTSSNRVRIDGAMPEIMDQEIDFAADAGLDYWAFLLYPESDSMSLALDRYLKSPNRQRINFCVILHNAFGVRAAAWPKELARVVALLKEPGYQTVLGDRPLVFEFQAGSDGRLRLQRLTDFRRAARESGLNPYCVFMGWNPVADFRRESANGFDAVSAYAVGSDVPTFAELVRQVEIGCWQKAADAKVPCVPLVTTGWDKQPRKENPVSWEKDHAYHRQTVFPARATPVEIGSHLEHGLAFVRKHPVLCAANAVILYAWNEHDEGGWLAPTWTPSGKPDTARLDAVHGLLRPGGTNRNSSPPAIAPGESRPTTQYILFNRAPGQGMNQSVPESLGRKQFDEVLARFPNRPGSRIQTGLSYIFSPFRTIPETTLKALRIFLEAAEVTDTPVLVQIDLEHWWEARPDLWNWWDVSRPGFNPANRENVEWTGWSPENAIKIAWRNWGQQIRVLPPPNLASPRYTAACLDEIRRLVPVVLAWHAQLPPEKKHLLIGVKLGHETSIGVNAYHYPGGNDLLGRPATEDPTRGLKNDDVLARGVAQIGYAALKSSGIRTSGTPAEAELRDVAQRYLTVLCREAAEAGVPRERLFAHGAGWKEDELIYDVPVNGYACPGWSFYKHAADPRKDSGVQRNLAKSDAPCWAATEWLLQGNRDTGAWRKALASTLADPRCRYVCIFNWESIRASDSVLKAITELVEASARN